MSILKLKTFDQNTGNDIPFYIERWFMECIYTLPYNLRPEWNPNVSVAIPIYIQQYLHKASFQAGRLLKNDFSCYEKYMGYKVHPGYEHALVFFDIGKYDIGTVAKFPVNESIYFKTNL